jgi:histidinol-phosphatase (PHP family)
MQQRIPQDYHVHTHFSCDAEASMERMCLAAIRVGVQELGFSDHFDLHPNEPFREYLDLESWWESYEVCKQKFSGELTLRAGVEVGEPHRYPRRVETLINAHPWDFVLGALHWVGDRCVFDHAFFEQDETSTYRQYFSELERMVDEGQFDILAHFDVVKRYGFEYFGEFQPKLYENRIRSILDHLVKRDLTLEINTSTLRRSIQQPSPNRIILTWFREQGGRSVTLGSDAHTPQDVGFGLRAMWDMVRSIRFDGVARYELREHSVVDFDENGP